MTEVNRRLDREDMDHIDHALGRPVDPLGETYRNNYAIYADTPDEKHFRNSPYWTLAAERGDMRFYRVNDAGRAALAEHLREAGEVYKLYSITFAGHTSTISAKSPGKAKSEYWRQISDCFPDMTFFDFLRAASVRVAG